MCVGERGASWCQFTGLRVACEECVYGGRLAPWPKTIYTHSSHRPGASVTCAGRFTHGHIHWTTWPQACNTRRHNCVTIAWLWCCYCCYCWCVRRIGYTECTVYQQYSHDGRHPVDTGACSLGHLISSLADASLACGLTCRFAVMVWFFYG